MPPTQPSKLLFKSFKPDLGAKVQVCEDDDQRVFAATAAVRDSRNCFWTGTPEAQHAIRAVCRIRCLENVRQSRHDAEGVEEVDVDASSEKSWSQWVATLSPDKKRFLEIYRSGAVKTKTRTQSGQKCECGHDWPSMRHLWQECRCFQKQRSQIQFDHQLPPSFWARQPQVFSKSGWVTFKAHKDPKRRAEMQVAGCKLGIHIIEAGWEEAPQV